MDTDTTPGSEDTLADASDLDLRALWNSFTHRDRTTPAPDRSAAFLLYLRTLVRDPDVIDDDISFCDSCATAAWTIELNDTATDLNDRICDACWATWADCARCDGRVPPDDLTDTENGPVCEVCRANYYTWCTDCEVYFDDENSDEHEHDGDDGCCDSPQPEFALRNDGCEPLANDTRAAITLPDGIISAEGLKEIRDYLWNYEPAASMWHDGPAWHPLRPLAGSLGVLGNQWQTKTGNYTKRLSRHAHVTRNTSLTAEVLSQVGCIARDHSTSVSVTIEVTRNLNLGAGHFYHDESCWWTSYSESRCALKTNGGFALRAFSGHYSGVSGRAWVLPLLRTEQGRLVPTFRTLTPDAFAVFNGYGSLSGYTAPRILAHMTGWTYRKINFSCEPMYINCGGYLVAPEDIAEQYGNTGLLLSVSQHSDLFCQEKQAANAAA